MEANKLVTTEVKTLESEIKAFISAQPYWAKYLCSEILAGNEITNDIIDNGYAYLLQELGLKERVEVPEITISYNPNASNDFKDDLLLHSIVNVEGVNALAENQIIELTKNLTIIYGANGAGKSGYVRLLKNAFYSKDKSVILPNVNVDVVHKPVSATFNFCSGGDSISLKYPSDAANGIFTQFSVFDGDIGKKHLSVRNDFSFRPASLKLFNEFNIVIDKLSEKLKSEILTKATANPFGDDDIFSGESKIKSFLINLSHNSKMEVLKSHLPYTDSERECRAELDSQYDNLKIALAQKDETLKQLRNIKKQLSIKKTNLLKVNGFFAETKLNIMTKAISDCRQKVDTSQKEGVDKFNTEKISNIGSTEWKTFIEAAQAFASNQNNSEYPQVGDNCLFCHQDISSDAPMNLIKSYWEYIKSVAEQDAKTAIEELAEVIDSYEAIDFNQFPENEVLTIWLNDRYENGLSNLLGDLQRQKTLCQVIIECVNDKKDINTSEVQLDLSFIDDVESKVDEEIQAYEEDEQTKRLASLLESKTYLAHKEKLESRYADIEILHENLIWVQKAKLFNKASFKTQSTNAEKKLSGVYFNSAYIDAFNAECESLNGNFGIEIDAKSSDAQSNRQLFLKNKDPASILSEGEQRVIALADFIAETNIASVNKGVVFDDPVNSLDEERKSVIAKRLVSISEEKQVVVFTHDLVFVSALINYATDTDLIHECHWIEKRNGNPGQVWLKNSPTHEKVYRNSEPVKKFYNDANKDDCPPEQREFLVKSGFTALRTCYEVLVINDLFKNVVQRYNERVSVDSLSSVYFDEELIGELLESFGQCCRYMEGHTHSDKYAYRRPESVNLNEEIQRYDGIRNKIKKFKKS
ncbi:hemin importer ATP-binding subunit [Citrobacter youngae]|uniref:AAA family ATPase n=1 Tax=Citrobacter youngae TaxID=133448 RepID=UPI000F51909E|nr:AAA family ATPase [Citrobacter youngae]RPH24416.1 hypothetical protein EHN13_14035 [Citrobacter youngae]VEI42429.1 hemin importer ATP-binding subunit [Citrobacter youngae]